MNKSPIWKLTVTWKASQNKSVPVQFSPYQVIGNRSPYLTLTINYTQHNWLQFTIRAHGQDSKLDTKAAESGQCGPANYKSTDNVPLPARNINNAERCYPQPGPARQIQDTHCAFCQKQPLCLSLSLSSWQSFYSGIVNTRLCHAQLVQRLHPSKVGPSVVKWDIFIESE